jgi:radical SAM superfamily enzyme YgiQ (UPF0313 family)
VSGRSLKTIGQFAGKMAGNPRTVVLVDFFWTRDGDPRVPLGHASLLAALRGSTSADVRSLVRPVNATGITIDDVVATILSHVEGLHPEAADVAFGVYVWSENLVQRVVPRLRARGFRGRIILGGPQISYAGPGVDRLYPNADVFVRGYGELALCGLATSPGRPSIQGVHYAGADDECVQASVDFDVLPSPWMDGTIPLIGQKLVRWETQRGCPYRCSFCQHAEAGARLPRRALPLDRVMNEIDLLCSEEVGKIAVLDPIFNLGPRAVRVLARFAELGFAGRLSIQCRAELVTPAFLDAAQGLDVCLEFGLQTTNEGEGAAVGRENKVAKVDAVLADCRRRRIDHEVSLIFGLPSQTLGSFEESVRWCIERQVPTIKAFPLLLLRGTELDRERARWGFIESGGAMPMVIESNSFGRDDWRSMAGISQALLITEGKHPLEMRELLALARRSVPELERWQTSPEASAGSLGVRE